MTISEDSLPRKFGRYQLLEYLGEGGMAEVILAKQEGFKGTDRLVAIKRILPQMSEDDSFVGMFIDELRIAFDLRHPNIGHILDVGRVDGTHYLAMEYIHGRDLAKIFSLIEKTTTQMPFDISVEICRQVASALDYAHNKKDKNGKQLKIVHRDIAPDNIIITFDGTVKLVDFGIAKALNRSTHTRVGLVKGKPPYMAPEQVMGRTMDARTDLFSMGVVLYRMITKKHPFAAPNPDRIFKLILDSDPKPPVVINPKCPKSLSDIVMKALAKNPKNRFPDARSFSDALDRIIVELGTVTTPRSIAGWLAGLFPKAAAAREKSISNPSDSTAAIDASYLSVSASLFKNIMGPEKKEQPPAPSRKKSGALLPSKEDLPDGDRDYNSDLAKPGARHFFSREKFPPLNMDEKDSSPEKSFKAKKHKSESVESGPRKQHFFNRKDFPSLDLEDDDDEEDMTVIEKEDNRSPDSPEILKSADKPGFVTGRLKKILKSKSSPYASPDMTDPGDYKEKEPPVSVSKTGKKDHISNLFQKEPSLVSKINSKWEDDIMQDDFSPDESDEEDPVLQHSDSIGIIQDPSSEATRSWLVEKGPQKSSLFAETGKKAVDLPEVTPVKAQHKPPLTPERSEEKTEMGATSDLTGKSADDSSSDYDYENTAAARASASLDNLFDETEEASETINKPFFRPEDTGNNNYPEKKEERTGLFDPDDYQSETESDEIKTDSPDPSLEPERKKPDMPFFNSLEPEEENIPQTAIENISFDEDEEISNIRIEDIDIEDSEEETEYSLIDNKTRTKLQRHSVKASFSPPDKPQADNTPIISSKSPDISDLAPFPVESTRISPSPEPPSNQDESSPPDSTRVEMTPMPVNKEYDLDKVDDNSSHSEGGTDRSESDLSTRQGDMISGVFDKTGISSLPKPNNPDTGQINYDSTRIKAIDDFAEAGSEQIQYESTRIKKFDDFAETGSEQTQYESTRIKKFDENPDPDTGQVNHESTKIRRFEEPSKKREKEANYGRAGIKKPQNYISDTDVKKTALKNRKAGAFSERNPDADKSQNLHELSTGMHNKPANRHPQEFEDSEDIYKAGTAKHAARRGESPEGIWSIDDHWEHLPPGLKSPPVIGLISIGFAVILFFAVLGVHSCL